MKNYFINCKVWFNSRIADEIIVRAKCSNKLCCPSVTVGHDNFTDQVQKFEIGFVSTIFANDTFAGNKLNA